jgi:hypothetical protein
MGSRRHGIDGMEEVTILDASDDCAGAADTSDDDVLLPRKCNIDVPIGTACWSSMVMERVNLL